MDYIPYLIITLIICLAGLVGTVLVGMKPDDKNYSKDTKSRLIILSIIYVVTFVPALIGTIVYFFFV